MATNIDTGPVVPPAWLDNNDLNGECFVAGELGEVLKYDKHRVIIVPDNFPVADRPLQAVTYTVEQAQQIVQLNAWRLAFVYHGEQDVPTALEMVKIAYLRFLVLRNGLASPNFAASEHNLGYSECLFAINLPEIPATRKFDVVPHLTAPIRSMLMENFTNLVCMVAYFFRVRGHHWLEDMEAGYDRLWKACLKERVVLGIKWKRLAHDAFHSIFPAVLDNFWTAAVESGNLSGALVVRYDSPPAGLAAVRAVAAGMADLKLGVPFIQNKFREESDYLQRVVDHMHANRWDGSINRRYYKANAYKFDEIRFAGVAATVLAALVTFAPTSPLINSPALKRVGNNAMITGAILTRMIATYATDPEVAKKQAMVESAT